MKPGLRLCSQGPVKWCKRCARKHPPRAPCHLIETERETKTGATVTIWKAP